MKPFGKILMLALVIVLLAACGPTATETPVFQGDNPYASQTGDADLLHDDISIDSSAVFLTKSLPPQMMVSFAYFQPTACHQLRVEVGAPDADNRISLKAYAITEKDKPCALMALATPLQASLNLGSFPGGHYFVLLNDNQIGEFDS